jgi:Tfp pilus assembly protein PilN
MRAVNLIPTDYRRGPLAGQGGVVASYALIGALAAVLIAVVMVILTNNRISDRETEVAKLEQQKAEAQERANALQSFASFRSMAELRTATVSSLAQSRFDWERIMRELSVVIPSDVWLTKMNGSVTPDVQIEGGASLSSRGSVPGPALEIVGCAASQDSVAKFVAALQDIDGATRVGVQSSVKPEQAAGSGGASGGGGENDECRTQDFITKFEIVVAFDAAPVPAAAGGALPTPAPAPTQPASATTPDTASGVGDVQQQEAAAAGSVKQGTDKAKRAVHNYVPGQ